MEGQRILWDIRADNKNNKKTTKTIQLAGQSQTPMNEEFLNIPYEIITEILARLPVKSLLKFRCVCKSWLSLISSPQFIKTHLQISMKDPYLANQRLLMTILRPRFNLEHCSLRSIMYADNDDDDDVGCTLDYPMKHPYRAVWVVGSVNGLVCIAINEKDLFLWNPCTTISNRLPYVKVEMRPGFYNIYGFGYNESRDDYKVMAILCMFGTADVYESVVMVYSLRSDSWKNIGSFNGGIPLDDSGKFAVGKLHFAMTPGTGSNFRWNIVSFDLESEAYGMVEQPCYGDGVSDFSLGVVGGCISVMCNCKRTRADVWVMKEYGVKESWAKVVTVPYFSDPGKLVYSKPLCILPTGEVLLVFESHFVVYNPIDNSLRRPETRNLGEFLEADIYLESLVSPAAIGR